MGIPGGHRVRALLVHTRLHRRVGVVPEGRRGAQRAVVAALAGGNDARKGRRSRVVPPDVGDDSPDDGDRVPEEGRGAQARATACTRRHRHAAACGGCSEGAVRGPAARLGGARACTRPAWCSGRSLWLSLRPVVRRPCHALAFLAAVTAAGGPSGAMTSMPVLLPPELAIATAVAFGAVIGSFLNVCIYRLPLGTSIVWPPSAC